MVRCRPGTVTRSALSGALLAQAPDQRCTVSLRSTLHRVRGTSFDCLPGARRQARRKAAHSDPDGPTVLVSARVRPDDYSAGGALGLVRVNVLFKLSHSSILAPWRCMIALCWSTESVLFQAQ